MAGTARSQSTDFYQNFKFHVTDESGYLNGGVVAGFTSVTLPDHNINHLEYSEGTFTYSQQYPGRSTFGQITLNRGVAPGYTKFAQWIRRTAEGFNYRSNLIIKEYHRSDITGLFDFTTAVPSRIIHCYNCIPTRFRPGTDKDGQNQDISIEELDFIPERFTIEVAVPGSGQQPKEVGARG